MNDCLLDMDDSTDFSHDLDVVHHDSSKLHVLFLNASKLPLFEYVNIKTLFQYTKSQISKIELTDKDNKSLTTLYPCLRMRDLRSICITENYVAPSITIKRFVIIITIVPIRCIILPGELILVLPQGADNFIDTLENFIEEWKSEQCSNELR